MTERDEKVLFAVVDKVARALEDTFTGAVSGSDRDKNIAQGLFAIAESLAEVANAIYGLPILELVRVLEPLDGLHHIGEGIADAINEMNPLISKFVDYDSTTMKAKTK